MINQLAWPKLYLTKGYTFSRWGCLTASLINAYNYHFKKNKTPNQVVPLFRYTKDGYLKWPSISALGMKLVQDIRKQSKPPHEAIMTAYNSKNQYAILEVNYGVHFVLLWGKYWPGLGYRIADSLGGVLTFTNWKKYKITGCRIVEII